VDDGQLSPAARAALQLHTELMTTDASEMTPARLDKLAADIGMLSGLVAAAYFV